MVEIECQRYKLCAYFFCFKSLKMLKIKGFVGLIDLAVLIKKLMYFGI